MYIIINEKLCIQYSNKSLKTLNISNYKETVKLLRSEVYIKNSISF